MENLNELFADFAKAQSELESAKKDSLNPFFKSKYADLSECLAACLPALNKNGLSLIQLPSFENGLVTVETRICHKSGQYLSSKLHLKVKDNKDDPQSVGATITYARRYGLTAMVGLQQEDDDGNVISVNHADDKFKAEYSKLYKMDAEICKSVLSKFKVSLPSGITKTKQDSFITEIKELIKQKEIDSDEKVSVKESNPENLF